MDMPIVSLSLSQAAGEGASRATFCDLMSRTFKLKKLRFCPGIAISTHAADYVTIQFFIGSTQIGSDITTNSSGGAAWVLGTLTDVDLSAIAPSSLEITSANPFTVRATQAGSGKVMKCNVLLQVEATS